MTASVFVEGVKYPLVLIQWYDHNSDDGWGDLDDPWDIRQNEVISIGWLIQEDQHSYVIVQNVGSDNVGCMKMRIFKGLVVDFRRVSLTPASEPQTSQPTPQLPPEPA